PDNQNIDNFETEIKNIITNGKDSEGETVDMTELRTEHVKAFPIRGYYTEKKPYLRIVTTSAKQRKIALNIILEYNLKNKSGKKLETASDDTTSTYYRKVAREYRIPLSGWALLTNYEYNSHRMPYSTRSPLCEHAFYLSINNFCHIENPSILSKTYPSQLITHDRALVLAWDIETHTTRGLEHLPIARYKEDNIFMIGITVHWKDDPKPLKRICLVDIETVPDPNRITIICGNEKNLLKAFALCWRALAPDIELTFNGSKYDWPFVVERATQWKILDWMVTKMSANPRKKATIDSILRWNYYGGVGEPFYKDFFHKEHIYEKEDSQSKNANAPKKIKNRKGIKIKITPDEHFKSTFLKVPGCVPIDVKVCCEKLYPKSEKKSLNYFLEIHDLDSKIDLSIKAMREYYTRSKENTSPETAENIRKIAEYCIVDSLSCQSLMVKRNVINDYREVASIAYVSLFDSHYYAGGMKVCNLLGAEAWKRDILITMIPSERTEKGTFPGAYVFPPDKGLENKRPVTGLDFASLYPSIIMNYNLSPETMTLLAEEAGVLEKAGEILYKIEFLFNGQILHAWSIRHGNKNNKMGLYPSVLKELLNKRNKMKAQLGILSNKKEYMELVISKIKEESLSVADAIDHILKNAEDKEKRTNMNEILIPLINETYENFKIEYDSICFDYTCLDSKQKAVKIYMNTFYGEAGNSLSPFFFLQLAGGVTSAGQYNIKLVAEYVTKKKGFGIKYGDTDSLYLTCPVDCYKECDLAYNDGKGTISKLEYWTEMVKITMKVMEKLRDDVNSYLRIKNRSTYLKMAYEEVLFPVVFTGKKKYFGIPHKKVPNFKPKDLFIKGIDTVKQGKSQLFKTIGNRIMWSAMDINNNRTLHEIVEEVLKEGITNPRQWNFEQFIETDAWKPNVDNKRVQRFIGRMKEKYKNKIPDPGERFSYVMVYPDKVFDLSGFKLTIRKADQMEFADVAKELNRGLDLSNYFENTINGLCARFIMYDKKYEPPSTDKIMKITDSDEKYKQVDTYAQNKAKKWLESYIKEINVINGIAPKIISNRGYAYKRAYKNAIKTAQSILHQKIGNTYEIFHGEWLSFEDFKATNTVERLWERFIEYAGAYTENDNLLISEEIKKSICSDFTKHLNALIPIIEKYDVFFHKLVYHMRYKEHITIPDKIGQPETMRKNEMITEQPTLSHISKTDQLALVSFLNTWNKAVSSI
ncbi:5237_t:CDS:1, partial [Paraglomus brasilianum]